MAINGTDLLNDPWGTTFSPFTDILGTGFWLIPISFIALALYVKTRDTTVASVWLLASTLILGSGNLFTGQPEMAFIFFIFTTMGIIGVIVSIYFMRK